ncbi:protein of unknown function (plasmid) [Azospirillum lipoferum 4B]|uniref:Uncharacterized protein n=1 Tax=Azospirillum lipoferum (strain 4B) TaxID=862719 RepID=G7ZA15_AZOL4|nr:protein of unknown function [Azospirillum lipoferum 4B]
MRISCTVKELDIALISPVILSVIVLVARAASGCSVEVGVLEWAALAEIWFGCHGPTGAFCR